MRRLTLTISGNVQKAGYRDIIIRLGMALGLRGYAENSPDGRVKVVAEGEEKKLELFEVRANLRNWHIFSEATGEFSAFYKLEGEVDEKMKEIIALLKELIEVWHKGARDICNTCGG